MNVESGAALPQKNEEKESNMKEVVDSAWESERACIQEIHTRGGFRMLTSWHPNAAEKLVEHSPDCVCCIDGRIAPYQNAIAVAGSGILIKDDPQALAQLVDGLRARGIRRVYMHDECGAVALYAQSKNISLAEAKKDANEWAEKLATLIGGEGTPETLSVSEHFHAETCVYLVLAEKFSLSGAGTSFPPGFQINAGVVSPRNAIAQVRVALDIALGPHGFGERFNREYPFTIVTVVPQDGTSREQAYIPALAELISERDGAVVLDSLVLP